MNGRHTFSDEDLTAYLDGALDGERRALIGNALKHDPALANRLESLSIDTGAISAAFDRLLPQAPQPPAFLDDESATRPPQRTALRIAAGFLVCLLAGAIGGYITAPQGDESWRDFVATYQALYINETLADVSQGESERREELARVTARISKPIAPETLTGLERLTYKRAQSLGFEGRALVQLTFLSDTGEPFALCIMRSKEPELARMTFEVRRGMRAASWSAGGYEYLLIGGDDETLIHTAAGYFAERL